MIASLRGLAVLAAVCVVLAVAVAIDAARSRELVDHRLLAGRAEISELRLARTRELEIRLIRHGETWRWVVPAVPADPHAVDAMVTALRGGRWHRSAARAVAGEPRATLSVIADGHTTAIGIGAPLPGAGQTWLAIGDHAYLVDDWIASALAPARLDLRIRHPFGDAAAAPAVEVSVPGATVRLEGQPRRVVAPQPFWPSPAARAALEDALAALELVSLDPAGDPTGAVAIHVGDATLTGGGRCGNTQVGALVHVHGTTGDGCVEAERWRAVVAAASALAAPTPAAVDPRPLALGPTTLVMADGTVIDRSRRPRVDGRDADPDRVAELVAALTQAAAVAPLPADRPTGTIVATVGGVKVVLEVHARTLVRRGEPVALVPSPEAWAAMTRASIDYRDPTRWLEEPTTIRQISIDGVAHTRGAVLGEWTNAKDPAVLEALAQAVGAVRAPAGPAPAAVEHRLDLEVAPPVGAVVVHHLELGPLGPDGCSGRADGTSVVLPLPLCTAVAAAAGH